MLQNLFKLTEAELHTPDDNKNKSRSTVALKHLWQSLKYCLVPGWLSFCGWDSIMETMSDNLRKTEDISWGGLSFPVSNGSSNKCSHLPNRLYDQGWSHRVRIYNRGVIEDQGLRAAFRAFNSLQHIFVSCVVKGDRAELMPLAQIQ